MEMARRGKLRKKVRLSLLQSISSKDGDGLMPYQHDQPDKSWQNKSTGRIKHGVFLCGFLTIL